MYSTNALCPLDSGRESTFYSLSSQEKLLCLSSLFAIETLKVNVLTLAFVTIESIHMHAYNLIHIYTRM